MSNTKRLPKNNPTTTPEPTPASAWKKTGDVLTLPSGNTLRVTNPGIMGLAHKGLVPNSLMTVIMDAVQKGKEPKPEEIMSENLDIAEMFGMMDNAIIEMAQEPKVLPLPEEGEPRDPASLYIDEISDEDKTFLWQWATGGTADVEQFRRESTRDMGALLGQQAVAVPAKRAASRKR